MLITEKLTISSRTGYISFIDEGVFLRIYNQSAYIITELCNQKLTLSCNVIPKFQNRRFVYCAFPKSSIKTRFKNAKQTHWGYELQGDFDLTHYENWFNVAYQQAQKRASNHPQNSKTAKSSQIEPLWLTRGQMAFLKSWQRGAHPSTVTDDFIENLKEQLNSTEPTFTPQK